LQLLLLLLLLNKCWCVRQVGSNHVPLSEWQAIGSQCRPQRTPAGAQKQWKKLRETDPAKFDVTTTVISRAQATARGDVVAPSAKPHAIGSYSHWSPPVTLAIGKHGKSVRARFNTALPSAKIGDTAEDGLNGNRVVSLKVVKTEGPMKLSERPGTAWENVKACLVVSYQKRVTSDVSETATWGGTPAAATAALERQRELRAKRERPTGVVSRPEQLATAYDATADGKRKPLDHPGYVSVALSFMTQEEGGAKSSQGRPARETKVMVKVRFFYFRCA
jgi:hypothetical protein